MSEMHSFDTDFLSQDIDWDNLEKELAGQNQPCPKIENLDSKLANLGKKQELIIDLLHHMQNQNIMHHNIAATQEKLEEEADNTRKHSDQINAEMKSTILELQIYIEKFSAKRMLTIWSIALLGASCLLLAVVIIVGTINVSSPFPEIAILVSIAFLGMAQLSNKKIK